MLQGQRTLEVAAARHGVAFDGTHDAAGDAIGAGQVARAIAAKHGADLQTTFPELHTAQARWHDQQADNFESYIRTQLDHTFTADRGWPVRDDR